MISRSDRKNAKMLTPELITTVKNLRSLIGKSPSTLRRWEAEGKIKPQRSKGNQRYYTDKDLHIALWQSYCLLPSFFKRTSSRVKTSSNGNGGILSWARYGCGRMDI